MAYTFNYSNAFTPGMGEALFGAAQQQANFSQMMKNNEIRMKERQIEMEEARLQMQQSKMLMQQRQAQRSHRLKQEQLKQQKRAQEIDRQLAEKKEQRLQQQLEWQMDQAGIERASEQRERVREEWNNLRAQGAVPAGSGLDAPSNSYTYKDTMGKTWRVPRLNPQQQLAREESARKERNTLRKWGAAPMSAEGPASEKTFTYTDMKGQVWEVPQMSKSGLDKDFRDTTIDVLEGRRESLQNQLENTSKSLMAYQERKRNLNKQIREKQGQLDRIDETHPRYKTVNSKLKALRTEKRKIDQNIRQMPEPKKLRGEIDTLNQRLTELATGQKSALADESTERDKEAKTSADTKAEGSATADLADAPNTESLVEKASARDETESLVEKASDRDESESGAETFARDMALNIHPEAPEAVKKLSPGQVLQKIQAKNPNASLQDASFLAIQKGYLHTATVMLNE